MPKIILFILLALSGINSFAQQQFYLYLQTSAAQPFYARIRNQIYSSSENGYLIVPQLHDSTYDVFIGFARNVIPEQHFSVDMNKQDQGFELRNFGEKGWGLFNIQNMGVIMNTTPVKAVVTENTGERKNDAFSAMLASVVNDSAILYAAAQPVTVQPAKRKPDDVKDSTVVINEDIVKEVTQVPPPPPAKKASIPPPEEKKQVSSDSMLTVKVEEKRDSIVVPLPVKQVLTTTTPVQAKEEPVVKKGEPLTEKPFIVRISETKNEEGYQAIYIEQYNFSTDTVNILIPAHETAQAIRKTDAPVSVQKTPDTTTVVTPVNPPVSISADTASKKKPVVLITNSDCINFATDNDVDKLRVKIMAENAVDDKLVAARKYFKAKCYSVKQIKALTELFPSDESRYRFFDTAYPFVSDTANFASLEELMGNDYYKNRFKAMIRK